MVSLHMLLFYVDDTGMAVEELGPGGEEGERQIGG